jgi:hypothetical protein
MNRNLNFSITAILLILTPMAFACEYPQRANIVTGQTASKEEMIASQKSVKTYMAAMEKYLACIESEETDAVAQLEAPTKDELAQRQLLVSKKHNAAVDEMEIVAAEFNNEVRSYKAQAE